MLTERHQTAYKTFYESTNSNEFLDSRTEWLVGLAAAIALNCIPCQRYYLDRGKAAGITKGEISEVLAKVIAVSAGQKRLQFEETCERYKIAFEG